jgi:hypothetical protein
VRVLYDGEWHQWPRILHNLSAELFEQILIEESFPPAKCNISPSGPPELRPSSLAPASKSLMSPSALLPADFSAEPSGPYSDHAGTSADIFAINLRMSMYYPIRLILRCTEMAAGVTA